MLLPNNESTAVGDDAELDATTEISVKEVQEPVDDSLEAWLAHQGTSLTLAEAAMAEQLVSSRR